MGSARTSTPIALLAFCLCLASDATRAALDCDDLSAQPLNTNVRWPQVWQALSDEAPCTQNCHLGTQPTAELDLGSLQISIYYLVGQPSSQDDRVLRVDPGNPEGSLLMQKIGCSQPDVGGPMPPPMGHLSLSLQALIYDWIAQGAYGENPEDPIPRDFVFRDSLESTRGSATPPPTDPPEEIDDESLEPFAECADPVAGLRIEPGRGTQCR